MTSSIPQALPSFKEGTMPPENKIYAKQEILLWHVVIELEELEAIKHIHICLIEIYPVSIEHNGQK